jgi:hypothetical protein
LVFKRQHRWFVAGSVVWSVFVAVAYTAFPNTRYPNMKDLTTSSLDLLVRSWIGIDFDIIFPSMIRMHLIDYLVGVLWLLASVGIVWMLTSDAANKPGNLGWNPPQEPMRKPRIENDLT